MFEGLELITADSILGLMAAFRADPDTRKVDLGVGVYRDDHGETPVLDSVRKAAPATVVHVSSPTWANHVPLISGAGLKLERYPYFDPATGGVQFAAML